MIYRSAQERKIRIISLAAVGLLLPLMYLAIRGIPIDFLQKVDKTMAGFIFIPYQKPAEPEPPNIQAKLLERLNRIQQRASQAFSRRSPQIRREHIQEVSRVNIGRKAEFTNRFRDRTAGKFLAGMGAKRSDEATAVTGISGAAIGNVGFDGGTVSGGLARFSRRPGQGAGSNDVREEPTGIDWGAINVDMGKDISSDYNKLLEWIKNHRRDLPPVFLKQMDGEPGFPQTIVEHKGAVIYMVVNEPLMLLGIAVVDGDSIGILTDHGLKKDIRKLANGEIERKDNEIVGINAKQRPARKRLYGPWYKVFQSWWETTG